MKPKKKKEKKSNKPALELKKKIGRALAKIRYEADLTRDEAAKVIGMPATDFENLERGIGRVLTFRDAKDIQSATGISAASLLNGDAWPVMLNGKPFTKEGFNSWQGLEIAEETKQAQVNEIGWMSALLLEAAGAKGNYLRRRTFHLLRGVLEEIRQETGISISEIHEAARMGAKLTTYQVSRDQLDDAIGKSPMYQAIRERLPANGFIQVVQEAFQTWCDASILETITPEVPDSMEVTRVIYRLQVGEQWLPVIADQFSGRGIGSNQKASKLKKMIGKAIPHQGGEEN
jgi:hypothetical protein